MTVLLVRADQAVSATMMAKSFGANLKSVTSGEQSHLVVFKDNEPAAVLMGIKAFQTMRDELEGRFNCCSAIRSWRAPFDIWGLRSMTP
jgi:antitoxin StbD